MTTHRTSPLPIYYEDTDAGGIVYHANYLCFAERARTDWLRALGFSQHRLRDEIGIGFVIRHISIDYLAAARLDDVVSVETSLLKLGKSSFSLRQQVWRLATLHAGATLPSWETCPSPELLASMEVHCVCIGQDFKPVRVPESLRSAFAALMPENHLPAATS